MGRELEPDNCVNSQEKTNTRAPEVTECGSAPIFVSARSSRAEQEICTSGRLKAISERKGLHSIRAKEPRKAEAQSLPYPHTDARESSTARSYDGGHEGSAQYKDRQLGLPLSKDER